MAGMEKFLFNRVFNAPPPPPPVAPEPEMDMEEDVPPPPVFSEAELDAARQQARKQGFDQGYAQAQHEALVAQETGVQRVYETLSQRIIALTEDESQRHSSQQAMILEVALTIARKLLPEFTSRYGVGEIEAAVASMLSEFASEPRLVVRLAESQLDALAEKLEADAQARGYAGKLIFIAEPLLQAGDCTIEWADGGLERSTTRLWQEIDRVTAQVLGAHGHVNAQAAHPPAHEVPPSTPVQDS